MLKTDRLRFDGNDQIEKVSWTKLRELIYIGEREDAIVSYKY